ncbi:DUF885 domain-containing protein [Microbulbifer sp. JMSA004]|uniref:DUF885 domain-containing protein n=1 Tax=Microbulbifer sp. JMSA004 TaxID=3243370 RepID=UPI004039FF37
MLNSIIFKDFFMRVLRFSLFFLLFVISFQLRAHDQNFDSFVESSNAELLQRDPSLALIYQVHEDIGLPYPGVTPISLSYKAETLALYAKTLVELRAFNRRALSDEQKIEYDFYKWFLRSYLDVESQLHFGVNAVTAINVQNVFYFFTLEDAGDIEHYLSQVAYLPSYYSSIRFWLLARGKLGVVDDKDTILAVRDGLNYWMESSEQDPLYLILESAVEKMEVSADQRDEWLLRCKYILEEQVAPIRVKVADLLLTQLDSAPENPGLSQYPGGKEYYNSLLSREVSVPLDALEVHQIGVDSLKALHTEVYSEFESLGYDVSNDLSTLYAMAREDAPKVATENILTTFEELLNDAGEKSVSLFPEFKYDELELVESFGYAYASAIGDESAKIYVNTSEDTTLLDLPRFVYHEGIPGHHAQYSFTGDLNLPIFRSITRVSGFSEGWGLYAERLAYEQGWYADNRYGNLGRLQAELHRAARLVVDTGINAKGWTLAEAKVYFSEATGLSDTEVLRDIDRFIYYPGQASSYHIGFTYIMNLRQAEQEKENFDLKAFHGKVLQNGVIPLTLLSEQFSDSQ